MLVKQHNIDAYDSVKTAFLQCNKVCSVCPTGSGKSYQALQLIRDNMDKKILYVTSLVTVKNRFVALAEKELGFSDFDCEIYSNLPKLGLQSYKADIIILDEFHRAGASTYQRSVEELLDHNPDAKVFGITATPVRYLDGLRDMSAELFDVRAFDMSLPEAIEKGILPIPTYVSCIVDATEIVSEMDRLAESSPTKDKEERAKTLIQKAKRAIAEAPEIEDILARHIRKPNGKYVVFCPNISAIDGAVISSRRWFSSINSSMKTYQVHSSLEEDSDTILEEFLSDGSDSLKLLFCVDMLSEGVHAEGIDGVIFMRATTSPIVFYQQMGRAFSSGGKSPLIIDMVNNISCLGFVENFREALTESIKKREPEEGESCVVEPHVYDYTLGLNECLQKLRACNTITANDWLDACREYVAKHGNLLVPMRYVASNGLPLGSWIVTKRTEKRKGKLNPDIESALEGLGIEWDVANKHSAEVWLDACREYREEHGDLRVPSGYITKDGLSLGNWINKQRQNKKRGVISSELESELSHMDMIWDARNNISTDMYLTACREYLETHGNLCVSQSYVSPEGISLGKWLGKQRQKRKNKAISKDIESALEKLGMEWRPKTASLRKWLDACREYHAEHGNLNIPRNFVTSEGQRLGEWLNAQRQAKKKGWINPESEEVLNSLGVIWEVRKGKRAVGGTH